jgi:hypothetical protein
MVLLNLVNCVYTIYNLSVPHTNLSHVGNSNEQLYKLISNYVIFAAIWYGPSQVAAIYFNQYSIVKLCPIGLNQSKYVP